MAKYQKYAEYKDSGVEWLGEIPSDWKITPLKFLVNLNPKKSELDETFKNKVCSFVPMEKLKCDSLCLDEEKKISEVFDGYTYFKNGDILLAKVTPCFENKNIAIANNLVNGIGFGSTEIYVLRTNQQIHNRYMFYRLQESNFMTIAISAMTGAGGLKRVPSDILLSHSVACPNYKEQTQIANFLDHETAKIDTLIAKQEKLIELLKEKRQAMISHAVTKGLNPDVAMKDSGVEWLGKVPEHWEVCKIQYYAKIESGHTPSKTNEKYWENCTIPWVSLNDSKQLRVVDYITDTKYQISELGLANSSARILPKETVVFTRDASIGLSAITTREMAVSQHLIAWLPNKEKLSPEFLLLIFYAMEKEFNRYTFGSTIKTIGMDDVSSLMASFPPLAEQLEIVSHSFSQFELIDTSIEKSNCLLNILKERRTALISSVVTGKIDVRNWQNPNNNNEAKTELGA